MATEIERIIQEIVVDDSQATSGTDRLTSALSRLRRTAEEADQGLDALSENAGNGGRAAINAAAGYDRLRGALDPTHQATRDFERGVEIVNRALRQGVITQDEAADTLRRLRDRFDGIREGADDAADELRGLDRATDELRGGVEDLAGNLGPLGSMLSALGPAGLAVGAGLAVAAGAMGALYAAGRDTIGALNDIANAAAMAGVSAESLQEMVYVGSQFGVSADQMAEGLKEMQLRLDEAAVTGGGEASYALKRLGLEARDLAMQGLGAADTMATLIDKMEGLSKPAQIRLVDELFGGEAGERFMEMVEAGADGIKALTEEARRLGVVFDEEVIAAASKAQADLDALARVIDVNLKSVFVDLAPAIVSVTRHVADFVVEMGRLFNLSRDLEDRRTATLEWQLAQIEEDLAGSLRGGRHVRDAKEARAEEIREILRLRKEQAEADDHAAAAKRRLEIAYDGYMDVVVELDAAEESSMTTLEQAAKLRDQQLAQLQLAHEAGVEEIDTAEELAAAQDRVNAAYAASVDAALAGGSALGSFIQTASQADDAAPALIDLADAMRYLQGVTLTMEAVDLFAAGELDQTKFDAIYESIQRFIALGDDAFGGGGGGLEKHNRALESALSLLDDYAERAMPEAIKTRARYQEVIDEAVASGKVEEQVIRALIAARDDHVSEIENEARARLNAATVDVVADLEAETAAIHAGADAYAAYTREREMAQKVDAFRDSATEAALALVGTDYDTPEAARAAAETATLEYRAALQDNLDAQEWADHWSEVQDISADMASGTADLFVTLMRDGAEAGAESLVDTISDAYWDLQARLLAEPLRIVTDMVVGSVYGGSSGGGSASSTPSGLSGGTGLDSALGGEWFSIDYGTNPFGMATSPGTGVVAGSAMDAGVAPVAGGLTNTTAPTAANTVPGSGTALSFGAANVASAGLSAINAGLAFSNGQYATGATSLLAAPLAFTPFAPVAPFLPLVGGLIDGLFGETTRPHLSAGGVIEIGTATVVTGDLVGKHTSAADQAAVVDPVSALFNSALSYSGATATPTSMILTNDDGEWRLYAGAQVSPDLQSHATTVNAAEGYVDYSSYEAALLEATRVFSSTLSGGDPAVMAALDSATLDNITRLEEGLAFAASFDPTVLQWWADSGDDVAATTAALRQMNEEFLAFFASAEEWGQDVDAALEAAQAKVEATLWPMLQEPDLQTPFVAAMEDLAAIEDEALALAETVGLSRAEFDANNAEARAQLTADYADSLERAAREAQGLGAVDAVADTLVAGATEIAEVTDLIAAEQRRSIDRLALMREEAAAWGVTRDGGIKTVRGHTLTLDWSQVVTIDADGTRRLSDAARASWDTALAGALPDPAAIADLNLLLSTITAQTTAIVDGLDPAEIQDLMGRLPALTAEMDLSAEGFAAILTGLVDGLAAAREALGDVLIAAGAGITEALGETVDFDTRLMLSGVSDVGRGLLETLGVLDDIAATTLTEDQARTVLTNAGLMVDAGTLAAEELDAVLTLMIGTLEAATEEAAALQAQQQALLTRAYGLTGDQLAAFDLATAQERPGIAEDLLPQYDAIRAAERAALDYQSAQAVYVAAIDHQIAAAQTSITALDANTSALSDLAQGLRQWTEEAWSGDASPLTPTQQLDAAWDAFTAATAAAQGGDLDEARRVTGLADSLLQSLQGVYSTASGEYFSGFEAVIGAVDYTADVLDGALTIDEQQLSVLEDQVDMLQAQRDATISGASAAQQTAASVDALAAEAEVAYAQMIAALGQIPGVITDLGGAPSDYGGATAAATWAASPWADEYAAALAASGLQDGGIVGAPSDYGGATAAAAWAASPWADEYAAALAASGLQDGGIVGAYAEGGVIGNGVRGIDSVAARYAGGGTVLLAGGEGVLTAPATEAIGGAAMIDHINHTLSLPKIATPVPVGGGDPGWVREVVTELRALRADTTTLARRLIALEAAKGERDAVRGERIARATERMARDQTDRQAVRA